MATALRLRASRTKFSPGDRACNNPAPYCSVILTFVSDLRDHVS